MKKTNFILLSLLTASCSVAPLDKEPDLPQQVIRQDTTIVEQTTIENCKQLYSDVIKLENFLEGDIVDSIQTDYFNIIVNGEVENVEGNRAIIFDSSNYTGEDSDLDVSQGNVLILSEDANSDNPDDNSFGGTLSLSFSEPIDIKHLRVIDVEEEGSYIRIINDGGEESIKDIVPVLDGNHRDVDLRMTGNIVYLEIFLIGSGAIDDIEYQIEINNCDN